MTTKYVIELGDDVQFVAKVGVTASGNAYSLGEYKVDLEELNSDYINEHFGELQDEAYRRGLNDGSLDVKQRVEGAYQRGLEDAWEAVKKIALMDTETSENVTGYFGLFRIMENLTPMQAIEKLKAYEDKRSDRIDVGDEVIDKDGDTTIVTNIHERLFDGLCSDGSTMSDLFLEDVRKTGRHYDHIGKLLEAIRA